MLSISDTYVITRQRIALEQTMTRQAELIFAMLGTNLPDLIRPHVVLKEKDDTASTDAQRYIYMPTDFDGIDTTVLGSAWARTALLAHEISHWLQPCKKIDQVSEETGLSGDFINVVMDIQGEALIASLLPYYNEHLTRLRAHVGDKYGKEYAAHVREAQKNDDFFGAVLSLSMIGRYVLARDLSFVDRRQSRLGDVAAIFSGQWKPKNKADFRIATLLAKMSEALYLRAIELPDFLREIVKEYPELCTQEKSPFRVFSPSPNAGDFGDLLQEFSKQRPALPQISFWEGDALGIRPASQEEQRRANAMQLHFSTPKGGLEIMAPGRFDRMAALSGSPMPWTMKIQDDAGKAEMSDVLVAVDISGSMRGEKWRVAISAARSITLAMRAAGGDVRGLVFDDQVWYARECDSKIFFASSVAGLSLLDSNNLTSFEWLPYFWQRFPNHRVVIITDGGEAKDLSRINHIPTRQRARTSALVIPSGNLENMKTVAANVMEVDSLELLAGAMVSVLPRRTM